MYITKLSCCLMYLYLALSPDSIDTTVHVTPEIIFFNNFIVTLILDKRSIYFDRLVIDQSIVLKINPL